MSGEGDSQGRPIWKDTEDGEILGIYFGGRADRFCAIFTRDLVKMFRRWP